MIQATLFLISYIFLIAIVIVYFDYKSRIVGLILLNSYNCSYSVYLIDLWVDGRQYVDADAEHDWSRAGLFFFLLSLYFSSFLHLFFSLILPIFLLTHQL